MASDVLSRCAIPVATEAECKSAVAKTAIAGDPQPPIGNGKTKWVLANLGGEQRSSGEDCGSACARVSGVCDASKMEELNDYGALVQVLEGLGVTCSRAHNTNGEPGSPFFNYEYGGEHTYCAPYSDDPEYGSKASCSEPPLEPHRRALCFCKDIPPPPAPAPPSQVGSQFAWEWGGAQMWSVSISLLSLDEIGMKLAFLRYASHPKLTSVPVECQA